MQAHEHHDQEHRNSPWNLILIGFLVIAGYFLVTEHWAHIVPILPWVLLLACPLMHLFMHRGHGRKPDDQSSRPHQH